MGQRVEVTTIEPRLVDVRGAALFLGGISTWTLRTLVANGHIKPVRLPAVRGAGEGRRLLFDVRDLECLIDKWKTP